ncbi:MAG TPA: hypothetical protein VN371_04520 [Chlorobaculum sp.]|nr:hypothetical protein [Chlorobaculum sp.]
MIGGNTPVVVWGAGSYTRRLLATTALSKGNLRYFVDNDGNKQGKELAGVPVLSPDSLSGFDGTIIIASALSLMKSSLKYDQKD